MKNKFLTKILGATLGLAMAIGVGVGVVNYNNKVAAGLNAGSLTGTINFNSSASGTAINAASVTGDDSLDNEWTVTTVGTSSYTANASYYQVGSSSKPATSITFTTSLENGPFSITAFSAKFGGFSGTAGTVTLKVGDTTVGSGSLNATNDVTVSKNAGNANGSSLTVTVTGISKGVKVYFISYTYETASTIQADSVTIKSGENEISGTYVPTSHYYVGGSLDLTASTVTYHTGAGYEAGTGAINWSSSDEDVATVADGIVSFVGHGTSDITATAVDKGAGNTPVSASFTLDISDAKGSADRPFTIAEARAAIDDANGTINNVYVTGVVSQVDSFDSTSKGVTYWISDDGTKTNQFEVFKGKGIDGADFNSVDDVDAGSTVTVKGNIKKYYSTYEFEGGSQIKSLTGGSARTAIEAKKTFSSLTYQYNKSENVAIDTLDRAATGISAGNSYKNWSDISDSSNARYAGNSFADNENSIQIRKSTGSQAKSAIISTTSGGNIRKVSVVWGSGNGAGRTLNIYGKNTAYTNVSDLYDNSTYGTLLGTIVYGTSTELFISSNYAYVGIVPSTGAAYLDSITFQWSLGAATYSYPSAAIRFGGLIRTSLWDELDGPSHDNIQEFGMLISYQDLGASTIQDKYNNKKTNENTIEEALEAVFDKDGEGPDAGEIAGKIFSKGVDLKVDGHPDTANDNQKLDLGVDGDYYIWYLNKNVTDNLTTSFTVVAFIRTVDDIVFLQETKGSAKSIAGEMVAKLGAGYAEGSLQNLANLA